MIILRTDDEKFGLCLIVGMCIIITSGLLYTITFPSVYPLFLIIPGIVIPFILNHFTYTRKEADEINMNRSI